MHEAPSDIKLPIEAREHLEKYWVLARRFYQESDFPLAAFFAITLIEEVGKVILLGLGDIAGLLHKKAFFSHGEKYRYAVHNTLVVNARVARIYGDQEGVFARWFREGELLQIRNRALYLELQGDMPVVPCELVPQGDAFLLVCIAGEVYAEIQGAYVGTSASEWQRVIKEIDEFRTSHMNGSDSA